MRVLLEEIPGRSSNEQRVMQHRRGVQDDDLTPAIGVSNALFPSLAEFIETLDSGAGRRRVD
jgi:hypothetical protein